MEGIALESSQISDFHGLVTLTLDLVILHTVMHQSSTSTYIPNVIEIEKTFCGRTAGRTDGHLRLTVLGRLGGVDLKTFRITAIDEALTSKWGIKGGSDCACSPLIQL